MSKQMIYSYSTLQTEHRNHTSFTQPSPLTGWVIVLHVSLSVSESVSNNFSPHPPPYIELSFSSSLCWYIYSPQTSQIQALEEGSAWTCVGATPQGPPTLDMRVKVSGQQYLPKGWKVKNHILLGRKPSLPVGWIVRILLLQGWSRNKGGVWK